MKRVLVTGSGGFIGSTLVKRLLTNGVEVLGIDNFTNSYDPMEKIGRTEKLKELEGFEFLRGDLASTDLHGALKGVSTVFHLAGRAGVRSSFDLYDSYVHDNIVATTQLLRAMSDQSQPMRLVYASSSSIYGNAQRPFLEVLDPAPVSPYGKTKLAAENLVLGATSNRISTVALRYFTVYGPEQRPDMGFRKFITSALLGREIEIYGDGSQSRDFTFVDDIVTATIAAGESNVSGMAINVGGGSTVTLLGVMKIISNLLGAPLRLSFGDFARGDVMHTGADLSRAQRYLHFAPATSLEEGLAREFQWLEQRISRDIPVEVLR